MQSTQCCTLKTPESKEFDIIVGVGDHDPISESILTGTYSLPHAFPHLLELVQRGDKVLDLGAHIGTFSLMAATAGCQVVAVEASPYNTALVQASIAQNGFDQMQVVSAAISDQPGELEFIQAGPFGLVAPPILPDPTVKVPAMTVEAVLAQVGWQQVDLIKMDIEGSEVAAIRGMPQLLSRDDAPAIFFESNGHTLHYFAETPNNLLAALEKKEYKNYLAEPERLVPVSASDLQAACIVDYLAFKGEPPSLEAWPIASPRTPQEIRDEVLVACEHPHEHFRSYTARALAGAEPALLADRRVRLALDRLSQDPHELVRESAFWWATARAGGPTIPRIFNRIWAKLIQNRDLRG